MSLRGVKNKERGKWKKLAVFLALLIIFGVLLNSMMGVYKKKKVAQEALVRMEKEAAELQDREKFLETSLEKLATQEGLEFEIRKKLNMAQIGESVAVIVGEEQPVPTPNIIISSWQKLKDFFIKLFEQ